MRIIHDRSVVKPIVVAAAIAALFASIPLRGVLAHDEPPPGSGGQYTPDTCVQGHHVCGDFQPLTPMHGAEGVHAGLVWKDRAAMPKILYWARFTDYRGIDVADPAVIQAKIDAGALTDLKNVNDFNAALRGGDFPGGAADTFKKLVYGASTSCRASARACPLASWANCSTIARSSSTSRTPTRSRTRTSSTPWCWTTATLP
jgi:hypothetical protein